MTRDLVSVLQMDMTCIIIFVDKRSPIVLKHIYSIDVSTRVIL